MAFKEEILIGSKADTRGFKKADSAAAKLNKTLKNLAGTIGIAYGARAITMFGKASVKAFAEDEKAALSLARTVQNLGLGFEAQSESVNKYISALEQQTGVLDDELRPALDRLLRATLNITKAQDLLNLSLDIAAGTGKSVTQVSQSLQKAYLGQTQALGRLGVGLSKAELTSASFEDIQKRLTYLFAGQAKDAAESYAGQLDKLTIASNNAKETIGKGLVDALITMSNSGNVDGLVYKIDRVANAVASATIELSKFIVGFKYFANPKNIFKSGKELEDMLNRIEMGKPLRTFDIGNNAVTGYQKDKAAQALAIKTSAAQVKATKALTAEQKKQNALKKSASIFDLEQVQIIAALKGKLSDEDRKRLELQLAIMTGNDALASKLTYEIAKAQGLGTDLAKFLADLPAAKNPFASWEAYLDMLAEKARQIASLTVNAPIGTAAAAASTSVGASSNVTTNVPVTGFTPPPTGTYGTPTGAVQGPQVIELKITGDGDLTNTIAKNLMQQSLSSGNQTYVNRRTGGFE
jgi:hypothetical protein